MSNKKKKTGDSGKRSYTQKARAERHEDVHLRITEAAVHFHGTVGPARTTMGEIAKRAGVRRATVYNHFPSDLELIDACSSHWFGQYPPPDMTRWTEIADPSRRLEEALVEMYEYYDRERVMLGNVLRDSAQIPALDEILKQKWWPMIEGIVELLAQGLPTKHGGKLVLFASLRVGLDFFTWKRLSDSGLTNARAAHLAAAWVESSRTLPL